MRGWKNFPWGLFSQTWRGKNRNSRFRGLTHFSPETFQSCHLRSWQFWELSHPKSTAKLKPAKATNSYQVCKQTFVKFLLRRHKFSKQTFTSTKTPKLLRSPHKLCFAQSFVTLNWIQLNIKICSTRKSVVLHLVIVLMFLHVIFLYLISLRGLGAQFHLQSSFISWRMRGRVGWGGVG